MATFRILPVGVRKTISQLPPLPGVNTMAQSIERALPKGAPRLSQAIPRKAGK